jgi:hypothetical protein
MPSLWTLPTLCLAGTALIGSAPVRRHPKPAPPAPVEPAPVPAAPAKANPTPTYGDIMRITYQSFRIYPMKLVPDAAIAVELPLGETFKWAWVDRKYFAAEAVDGDTRILVRALPVPGVVGRRTTLHIITQNDLRISFSLEAVDMDVALPPAVWHLVLEGSDEETTRARILNQRAQEQAEKLAAEKEHQLRQNFEAWKITAMENMDDRYSWTGDWPIARVVTNGVQTFLYLTAKVSQPGTITLIGKSKEPETVDFEYHNGVYTINHVLAEREKFKLQLAKDVSTIKHR